MFAAGRQNFQAPANVFVGNLAAITALVASIG
jgi:hypothetical protein